MRQLAAWLSWLLAAAGCTPSNLEPVPEDAPLSDRVAVRGEVCTRPPAPYAPLTRVLFSVDSSESMLRNDPSNLIVDAMEHVVDALGPESGVKFGLLRWGERTVRELVDYEPDGQVDPELFTEDREVLGRAFERMRQLVVDNPDRYLGGTDYGLALSKTEEYLEEDVARHPSHLTEANYVIIFITDGMPQSADSDADTTRQSILTKVEALTRSYRATVATAYVGEVAVIPREFLNLLPEMAQLGGGGYVQVDTPAGLMGAFDEMLRSLVDLFLFDLAPLRVDETSRSVLVSNESVRIAEVDGVVGVYADSDADGLVDPVEIEIFGSDPANADTDGDGLGDFFEAMFLGEFDPTIQRFPVLTEQELADDDGDGLGLLVETHLGTDPGRADTDGDGLSDGVEFYAGTGLLVDDVTNDRDRDGVPNGTEILEHTSPILDEGEQVRRDAQYALGSVGEPVRSHNGRSCYEVSVENITLMETLPATDPWGLQTPRGFNRISVTWLEGPAIEALSQLERARLPGPLSKDTAWIIYRPSEVLRDPPALELFLRGGTP